jgi:penicillin amidase
MQSIQADTFCLEAKALRPYLLGIKPSNDAERRAIAEVQRWDLRYEPDRVGASIYHVWQWLLLQEMVGDELGAKLMHDYRHVPFQQRFVTQDLLAWDANPWFDHPRTLHVRTRQELLHRSLADAVAWLAAHFGNDPAGWTWGRLHRVTFGHLPLGQAGVAPLDWIFNPRPVPAAGGPFTVNAATPSSTQPFMVVAGTSQRFIADLADLGQSLAVNSTGQSGLAFHAHRDDQIALWHRVGYHRVFFDRQSLETASEGTLTLTPR